MLELLRHIDTSLFLYLNGKHNEPLDWLMYWVTYKYTWIPLYIFLFYIVWKKFEKKTWLVLAAVVVLITFSDQISVHCFKNVVQRYRPCYNWLIKDKVHLVDGCGGTYGFISSHAANTFALAMFLSLLMRVRNFTFYIFLWAMLVSYSRIYTGVHYPLDITGGAMVGMAVGIVVAKIYYYLEGKIIKT